MERIPVHLVLHFLVPALVARLAYKDRFYKAWGVMTLMMVVDLDHLLADPVFDPQRCSIGFHPLHSYIAIGIYVVLLVISKTQLLGVGLLIHMILDGIDCFFMQA